MVSWDAAWRRAVNAQHPLIRNRKQSDFRPLSFVQVFPAIAIGAVTGPQLQTFASGAFVLGIAASATFPRIIHQDQYYADALAAPLDFTFDRQPTVTPGNRDLFALDLSYTNDENLTPGGPAQADALLGSGQETNFPHREIIIDPSQGILCRAQNLVTLVRIDGTTPAGTVLNLTVNVVYKTMSPRLIG